LNACLRTEKYLLEEAAFRYFKMIYQKVNNEKIQKIIHYSEEKPDFIAKKLNANEEFGVEIMHLYYDEKEAKMLLNKSKETECKMQDAQTLIKTLNSKLEKKYARARKYEYEKSMILVIRIASPIFNKDLFEQYLDEMFIDKEPFREIWLLFMTNSSMRQWCNYIRLL